MLKTNYNDVYENILRTYEKLYIIYGIYVKIDSDHKLDMSSVLALLHIMYLNAMVIDICI